MGDVARVIKEFVGKELATDGKPIESDETRLIDEAIIDSLGIFVLVDFLQHEFKIKIQPVDVVMENFDTIAAIEQLVATKQRASVPTP